MSKSAALRLGDLKSIYTLVGECRELGDDPGRWRYHLFRELGRLVAAGLTIGGEMGIRPDAPPHDLGTAEWGWENGFNRAGWLYSLERFARDPGFSTLLNGYLPRLAAADGVCLARTSYVADGPWYRSEYYDVVHRVIGIDPALVCFRSVPGTTGEFSGIILGRAAGEPDFTRRAERLVQEAHAAVAPLIGGPLARFADPSPAALPPRVRQVLRCVLEGDSDKQITARLALSRHTVNQYTKLIFRHFRVESRAELLARWVRRGWGGRFAWADPVG